MCETIKMLITESVKMGGWLGFIVGIAAGGFIAACAYVIEKKFLEDESEDEDEI